MTSAPNGKQFRLSDMIEESATEDPSPPDASASEPANPNEPSVDVKPDDVRPPTDQPSPAQSVAPVTRLDRRWVSLQRMTRLITAAIIAVAAAIPAVWLGVSLQAPWNMLVIPAWLLIAAALATTSVVVPKLSFDHWSYQLGDRVIEIRYGIIWQVTVAIPLSRLQHVDLHRGPLERRFGLCSLEIHTAGTQAASQTIPGLSEAAAQALRDRLIDAANRGVHGDR